MLMRPRKDFSAVEISDIQSAKIDKAIRERAIRLHDIDMASRLIATDSVDAGWYCLSVRPGREKAVQKSMEEAKVHALIPMCKGKEKHRRGRVIPASDMPVMIGYVLVRVAPSVQAFRGLTGLDHVQGVVGGLDHPFRVNDREVIKFKRKAEEGAYDYRDVKLSYARGEVVRVSEGPFASFTAVVVGVDRLELRRVQVEVNMFGRAVPVELDVAQIEKL